MQTPSRHQVRVHVLRRVLAAALGISAAGTLSPAAGAQCPEITESFRAALGARALEDAARHYDALVSEPTCDDPLRYRAGSALSALFALVAQDRMEAGESLASQRPMLEQSLHYARTWPVLALLGDAAHEIRNYDEASVMYQEALKAIDDEVMTPTPPPQSQIERIFKRAEESRMLARAYHPTPRTRSGAPGGLASASIGGMVIKRVQVPITFHVDTAQFTEKGRLAAEDLAGTLRHQAPEHITIAGHTDPSHTEEYNLALSRRRAEAVASYLSEQGFRGQIEVVAMGESQRFPLEDPSLYTREERYQMDRRVELIR